MALYDHNGIVGGLGVSGDTSCADHNIAWRVRQRLKPDQVPTVGNLSRELLVTQHSGSELVERLVAKGLLVREPGLQDRRPMLLWVTPAANKLLSQMAKAHLEELRRLQPTLIALFQRFGGPMHGGTAARG